MRRELRVAIVGAGELAGRTWAVVADTACAWLLVTTAAADDVPLMEQALRRLGLPGLVGGCSTILDLRPRRVA